MEELLLHELKDEVLDNILSLDKAEQLAYFANLVQKFYSHIESGSQEQIDLIKSYKSSFCAEKLYRDNPNFQDSFTVIYTRTGLIREIISDIYYNEESLIIH